MSTPIEVSAKKPVTRKPASDVEKCSVDSKKSDICKCKIDALRPTQFTVGLIEVQEKRDEIRGIDEEKLAHFQQKHPEPTVVGPNGELYISDHHHLARALYDAGIKSTYCEIHHKSADMSMNDFWKHMDKKHWVYPFEDGKGPLPYSNLPKSVDLLRDDPYRSLAGAVRKAGDYDKSDEPFAEFQWADFFRSRVSLQDLQDHFHKTVKAAGELAHTHEAKHLPGFRK